MFGMTLDFDAPWFLLLLLIAPAMWVFSFKSLAGLGKVRRFVVLVLETCVLTLIVGALAEFQIKLVSERVTVLYLLDQSESIPLAKRQLMLDYVIKEVQQHRNARRHDRAGVIVFGQDAKIEIPPLESDVDNKTVESLLGSTEATNLTAAFKLAQAAFPADSAKRIVLVSDGNENLEDVRAIAPKLAQQGIGIDVVPVKLSTRSETAVEKVVLPVDVRKGQPVEARVVINNYTDDDPDSPNKNVVPGKLIVKRVSGKHEELLVEQQVKLDPGKNVFPITHTIDEPAVYTYKATFTPDDPDDDLMRQNNEATAFTHVRGKGRVLLIEDHSNRGEFEFFIQTLRKANIEVVTQGTDELFTNLIELQAFDCVILANVPRSSGERETNVHGFTDNQIEILVRNTQQMGCGLVMLGGPNSFAAGGWNNTKVEEAMPVDFAIKNTKIQAVGALVMMMHASEIPEGNFWQKVVAKEAIKALGPMDYCGLIHFGMGGNEWLWGGKNGLKQVGQNKKMMMAMTEKMTPGDMPDFDPAMRMALAEFNRVPASVKHMIVISDGDPSPPNPTLMAQFSAGKIQISTVAIGAHGPAESGLLQKIATQAGGKYYAVNNAKALPRIYQQEARKVARPVVYEPDGGVQPQIKYPHEILNGIDKVPPIKGFVLTTVKDNPLVEVALVSPQPEEANGTILAAWTYGLGRTAVLTTDTGRRWADQWTRWENYEKLMSQTVRWAMRPVAEQGKFTVATDFKDGKVKVVITALDEKDEFLNFLTMSGSAVGPNLEPLDISLRQTAPGRYVGEFEATKAGSYFMTVTTGAGREPILAGVNVPYSSEFRVRTTNDALLESLAQQTPKDENTTKVSYEPGLIIKGDMTRDKIPDLLKINTFRHNLPKRITVQDVWPQVIVAASCLFFGSVLVRRVSPSYEWIAPAVNFIRTKILRRELETPVDSRLERLRSKKLEVSGELEKRRAATRFDPQPDPMAATPAKDLGEVLSEVTGGSPTPDAPKPTAPSQQLAPQTEQEGYTSRLLKAKKNVRRDQ